MRKAGTDDPFVQNACCGKIFFAWMKILVQKRRAFPRASLNADLAAVAHYMLARYHVCAGEAAVWQMNRVIDGYDNKKRRHIAAGDKEMKSIAITPGNPPFPPDFALRKWASKGALDGDIDHTRCNSSVSPPILFPDIDGNEQ